MRLIEYIPLFLREVLEYRNISDTETPRLETLKRDIDSVFKNQFIATADNYGLSRFETFIQSFVRDDDTLDMRRKKLLLMMSEHRPYTIKSIELLLNSVFGEKMFKLTIDNFELTVSYDPSVTSSLNLVEYFLRRVLPANIHYEISEMDALLPTGGTRSGTHKYYETFTHESLEIYTHKQVEEGV